MKTLIIFNTVNRPSLMIQCIGSAVLNTGIDESNITVYCRNQIIDKEQGKETSKALKALKKSLQIKCDLNMTIFEGKNLGNSAGLNYMLNQAVRNRVDFDYYCILGDDIIMPPKWLKLAIEKHKAVKHKIKVGSIGFNWRDPDGSQAKTWGQYDKELDIFVPDKTFGCWVLPKEVFDDHGYFTAFTNYGRWDSEFLQRLQDNGRTNFYIPNQRSFHQGADVGNKTDYRKMKDDQLRLANKRIGLWAKAFNKPKYVPYDQSTWEQVKDKIDEVSTT